MLSNVVLQNRKRLVRCVALVAFAAVVVGCSDADDKITYTTKREIVAGETLKLKDLNSEQIRIENTSGIATYHFVEVMTVPGVITKREIKGYIGKALKRTAGSGQYLSKLDFGEPVDPLFAK